MRRDDDVRGVRAPVSAAPARPGGGAMERDLTIRHYMSRELILLRPEMDLHEAMRLFVERDISGAPVVDPWGSLIGILSDRDVFRAGVRSSYYAEPWGTVANHMSAPVRTLEADTTVIEAVETFYRRPYRRYPVVAGGRLVGLVARRDVLRALAALARGADA
jgi:CBS domain-containing protein